MARRRRRAGVVPVLPVASTTAPPTGAVARPDLPEIARVIRNPSDKAVLAVTFVASLVENELFLSVRNKEPFEFVRAGFNWSLKFNCDTTNQLHLRCDRQNDLHCNQWKLDYDVLVCCSSQVNPNHKCPDFTKSGTCTAADAPEISIPINDEFWKTLVEMPPEGQGFVKTAVWAEVHFTCKQMSGFRSLSNFSYDFSQVSRNSDAVFKFGKESVFVNCNLLSHHSEYFSATQNRLSDVNMTRDSNGLPIVEVEGVDPTEFTELMQIVYPSRHEITDTNIDYILELADRFRFETVLKDCEKFLLSGESCFDVTTMLYWSSRYTMRELQEWCFSQFISPEDFDELFVSDIYRNSQLPLDVVMVLLRKSRNLSN